MTQLCNQNIVIDSVERFLQVKEYYPCIETFVKIHISVIIITMLLLLEMVGEGSPSAAAAFQGALHLEIIQNMDKILRKLLTTSKRVLIHTLSST